MSRYESVPNDELVNLGDISQEEALKVSRIKIERDFEEGERVRRHSSKLYKPCRQFFSIVAGGEGTLKSTLAEDICGHVQNAVVIDRDKHAYDIFSKKRDDDPIYKRTRGRANELTFTMVKEQLKRGRNVILDAPFPRFNETFHNPVWSGGVGDIALDAGAYFLCIYNVATEDARYARIKDRKADRDKGRSDKRVREIAATNDRPTITFPHMFNDTSSPETGGLLNDAIIDSLGLVREKPAYVREPLVIPVALS